MNGFDLEFIEEVAKDIRVPLIAAGGAGSMEDFHKVLQIDNVSAAGAASIFHFTETTPGEVKEYLHEKGIPVRL